MEEEEIEDLLEWVVKYVRVNQSQIHFYFDIISRFVLVIDGETIQRATKKIKRQNIGGGVVFICF